ncbi:MAG: sigma-70 family RNA polymerase sigma factor [Chryseolinea sp.]
MKSELLNEQFIQQINQNIGIAHKVSGVYFLDVSDREDVLQEMMYQLWKSYEQFDGRSKFSTWMYRVCLNTAFTYHRKNKNNKNESLSLKHLEIAEQGNQHQEENIKMLFQAIATLHPLNKAITLLYLDDLSYEEIASITGLTKSNISVRLVRIKKELEIQLKKII